MKLNKLGIPVFNHCDRCVHRLYCEDKSDRVIRCASAEKGISYKLDRKANEECKRQVEAATDALAASLKVTNRSQITFTSKGLFYVPKDDETRRINSRDRACVPTGKATEWKLYCENCGAEIVTVNETRRLCNSCHEEICERLGVDYSATPLWSKAKAAKIREGR